jgi:hypothetical protein
MPWDDWDDDLSALLDADFTSSSSDGLRHRRPKLYYGVVIGIVLVLAVLVYVLLW